MKNKIKVKDEMKRTETDRKIINIQSKKGQVLILVTVLMAISLMVYFLVATTSKLEANPQGLRIGEYQKELVHGLYEQKVLNNYLILSTRHSSELSILHAYKEGLRMECPEYVDPLLLNDIRPEVSEVCKVNFQELIKKQFNKTLIGFLNLKPEFAGLKINYDVKEQDNKILLQGITSQTQKVTTQGMETCDPNIMVFHGPGEIKWKITHKGIEAVKDGKTINFNSVDCPSKAINIYGPLIKEASSTYGVPEEILVGILCNEAADIEDPYSIKNVRCEDSLQDSIKEGITLSLKGVDDVYCCNHDPTSKGGYNCVEGGCSISQNNQNKKEYNKYSCSIGISHMLPETAKTLGFEGHVDDLKKPEVSIPLTAKYLAVKNNQIKNSFGNMDPVLLAITYNAGSLRSAESAWGYIFTGHDVEGTSNYVERFISQFNSAVKEYGRNYCSSFSIAELNNEFKFNIEQEFNQTIFKAILNFTEEVKELNHETDSIIKLQEKMREYNSNSKIINISLNSCEESNFTIFYEELYKCLDSPDDNCSCEFWDTTNVNLVFETGEKTRLLNSESKNGKELLLPVLINSHPNGIFSEKNILYFNNTLDGNFVKEKITTGLTLKKTVGKTEIEQIISGPFNQFVSSRSCITDDTKLRLCARLKNPIVLKDYEIRQVGFAIEYYEKPKKLDHAQVFWNPNKDYFNITFFPRDHPDLDVFKYKIITSNFSTLSDGSFNNPIWYNYSYNAPIDSSGKVNIKFDMKPLNYVFVYLENTKGLLSEPFIIFKDNYR